MLVFSDIKGNKYIKKEMVLLGCYLKKKIKGGEMAHWIKWKASDQSSRVCLRWGSLGGLAVIQFHWKYRQEIPGQVG